MHLPRRRRTTLSDDPLERRIYEEAAKDEETFLMLHYAELLDEMPAPVGWRKRRKRGRPPKRRPGHQEEFGWKSMVLCLLLKELHGLTFRETASHLRANPELVARIGLSRTPSAMTINRALHRLPEAWLKRLNRLLLETAKGGRGAGRGRSEPAWIVLE